MAKKPTPKQKRYLTNITDPHCNSKKEAALAAGYTESTASKPDRNIESTSSFRALLDATISEYDITHALQGGLNATRPYFNNGKRVNAEDWLTRKYYVDMLLKLRGDYAPERKDIKAEHTHAQLLETLLTDENEAMDKGSE